jgi:hypothetical protein
MIPASNSRVISNFINYYKLNNVVLPPFRDPLNLLKYLYTSNHLELKESLKNIR